MIHNTNALDLLRHIPNASVDLIVTDPPYRVISGGKNDPRSPKGILSDNNGKIFEYNDIHHSEYMSELFRVLKNGSQIYVFTNQLTRLSMESEMIRCGFKIHDLLIWKKQNVVPTPRYMKVYEPVIFARKGAAKTLNNCSHPNVIEVKNPIGNKMHPTEKPVELLEIFIANSSNPNDIVLDPFIGSGSTGVACQNLGRRFIGSEIDVKYYMVACNRLKVMPI